MKILIADDDLISQRVLTTNLNKLGYDVAAYHEGTSAYQALTLPNAPKLAILDWMMPGLDGVEACRQLRLLKQPEPTYVILLTGRSDKESVVTGLDSGADDYLTKPFNLEELRARLQAGRRIVELQQALADRVRALEATLAEVKQLHGLLPMCAWCKRVRDDGNYWQQVEQYIACRTSARFSHGICPDCYQDQMTETVVSSDETFSQPPSCLRKVS